MNAGAVLKVAAEVRDSRAEAAKLADACDQRRDPIGAAYADGMLDVTDASWADRLELAACGGPRDLEHALDMAAFELSGLSIAASDMMSALAAAVKAGDRNAMESFEREWLRRRGSGA